MSTPFDQSAYRVRFDWGPNGLRNMLGGGCAVIVVVDVLSFTTSVDVAVSRGAVVLPYRWDDGAQADYAAANAAELASPRRHDGYSLAPSSLVSIPEGTRLVLPSPNGSALSFAARDGGATVLAGCLRNASAVGAAAAALAGPVGVLAAGERWKGSTGPMRVAIEDLLGAGAILAAVAGDRSPEAALAVAAFEASSQDLLGFVSASGSGRELIERGSSPDVALAAQHDVSRTVPVLRGAEFVADDSRWER